MKNYIFLKMAHFKIVAIATSGATGTGAISITNSNYVWFASCTWDNLM